MTFGCEGERMWLSFSPLFIAHMTESDTNKDTPEATRLYPEDQAKVDEFIARGVNSVPRKPFKPIRLGRFKVLYAAALRAV